MRACRTRKSVPGSSSASARRVSTACARCSPSSASARAGDFRGPAAGRRPARPSDLGPRPPQASAQVTTPPPVTAVAAWALPGPYPLAGLRTLIRCRHGDHAPSAGQGRPLATVCRVLRGRAADERAQAEQGVRAGAVIHPDAPLLPVDQPGIVQDLEVMADRRLRQAELPAQVAGAASPPGWEATSDIRRRRTGSASALSSGATCSPCWMDRAWTDRGEQHAAVSAGSRTSEDLRQAAARLGG